MNARLFISLNLIALSFLLWVLPKHNYHKGAPKPQEQIKQAYTNPITPDKAAIIINQSNAEFQFIDVRSREQYLEMSLPGAINIPLAELSKKQWQGYLKPKEQTNILYSNGDYLSNMALALLESKGYTGNTCLKGGMNAWYETVMQSKFKGGRLTARENALYGNRAKAKNLFIQMNSLPDSLKNIFLEAKLLEEEALDGGCE